MKRYPPLLTLLLLWSTWLPAQLNEFSVRSLPQLIELEIENIWTGDVDQFGHLIFSVTEADNPVGLYEYVADTDDPAADSLNQLLDLPGIYDLGAYQSQYASGHRVIYFIQWVPGTGESILYRFTSPDRLRPHLLFNDLMYGLEVSNLLNSGDVVVWGNKTMGELYDNEAELTGTTKNGIIHALLNSDDPDYPFGEYRAWTKDVGIIPGPQYCAVYINQDFGKLIGGFGPSGGDGYATRLYCGDGTSAILEELPQPEEAEYTWMGTVPYVGAGSGTMRFMAAGRFDTPNGYEYQLLIWNEDLTDYEVYQNFGLDFPGQFKVHSYIVDTDGNDALVLGGDNINLAEFGFPEDYSGLIVLNSDSWQPLEEILGYSFLDVDVNEQRVPDFRVLDFNEETGELWCAGKQISGKDDAGADIQAGFIIQIDDLDGNLFPQISTATTTIPDSDLRVYPNPGPGYLTIESHQPLSGYRLFDLSGRALDSQSFHPVHQLEIDLSDKPDGVYLLQLQTEGQRIPVTVIKSTTP